ncbi:hypothetical protein ABZP36_003171 [Zizania latifolia]
MACAFSASTLSSAAAPLASQRRPSLWRRSRLSRSLAPSPPGSPSASPTPPTRDLPGPAASSPVPEASFSVAFLKTKCMVISFAEITAFSDRYEEFEKINTEILGVSIDSVYQQEVALNGSMRDLELGYHPDRDFVA